MENNFNLTNIAVCQTILMGYTYLLYVPLIILTFWLYGRKIYHLSQKSFHMWMLSLSQLSYLLQLAVITLQTYWQWKV